MDKEGKNCPKPGVKPGIAFVITIVTVTIVVLLMIYIGYRLYYGYIDKTLAKLTKDVEKSCLEFGPARYRYALQPPLVNGTYERKVATALWDIGTAVSLSNCTDMVGIPPPFDKVEKVVSAKDELMYAHIFSNSTMACIAFSGTYSKAQWYSNLDITQARPDILLETFSLHSSEDVRVHHGYYEIYKSIREELREWWFQNRNGKTHLFITGHSLGGAMSTLCAFDFAPLLQSSGVELVHYAMSSPRVGNPHFSRRFDQISPYSIRVYNTEDIVIALPPSSWNGNVYQHICAERGSIAFTKTLPTLAETHIDAYEDLP